MSTLKSAYLAFLLAALFSLTACDTNEGPFEEAGEEIDQAVDEAGDKAEEAKEEMSN